MVTVTIIKHVFINIFQVEPISAVKFDTGCEKNMSFLVIPKSPKVWKKVEKIGLSSFNNATHFLCGIEIGFNLCDTARIIKVRNHLQTDFQGGGTW